MCKTLIRSEQEFGRWISEMERDAIDTLSAEKYPPEKYPCLIAYHTQDIDSMRYAEMCDYDYIYLSDFDDNE